MSSTRLIFGFHAVTSRLRQNPDSIKEVFIDATRDDQRVRGLIKLAESREIHVITCNGSRLANMVGNDRHQGVVANIDSTRSYVDIHDVLDTLTEPARLLVLDGIQDPHNLGACLRVADAFGVHAVIAPKDRAVGLTATVYKVSSGAADIVPFIAVTNLSRTLKQLKEQGIWIIGTAENADYDLISFQITGPVAWVFGSEEKGLRRLTREACDQLVRIPMLGSVESLMSLLAPEFVFSKRIANLWFDPEERLRLCHTTQSYKYYYRLFSIMNLSAPPNFKAHFSELFHQAANNIAAPDTPVRIELARTKQASHGDYSCNLAMQLAKPFHKNPREVAQLLIDNLPVSPYVEKIEVAGAGFINLFLKDSAKQHYLHYVLQSKDKFGSSDFGQGKKVQVEFVSANPTGPLHVGHGRGAAIGASLSNILTAAGFRVSREFYVNDAGRQMDILTLSTWLRYLELNHVHIPFPENAYRGEYVKTMAQLIHQAHAQRYVHQSDLLLEGIPDIAYETAMNTDEQLDQLISNAKKILGQDYAYIHNFVLTEQLGDCRNDLMEFGVEFDIWFSEQSLFDNGLVAHTMQLLDKKHHLYQQDGATWFRSTDFGDEKDRVVQRENGQFTYFASDIAYHLNKFERGFDQVINIWGADHHGYIARVKGALQALELDPAKLEIALVQFAVLYRDGKKAQMSTRSGEFVTLRELRQEVGKDAARFFYVMRKSDQHLDFDLDLAKSQSNDNPVYYVQYAHARVCSVLAQWDGDIAILTEADTKALSSPAELALLQRIIDFPDTIEAAAKEFSPHLIAFYLKELASEFHSYYNSTRFLVPEIPLLHARLALVASVRQILNNGLGLLGVSAPDKM